MRENKKIIKKAKLYLFSFEFNF